MKKNEYIVYLSCDNDKFQALNNYIKAKYNLNKYKLYFENAGDATVAEFEIPNNILYVWADCFIDYIWIESNRPLDEDEIEEYKSILSYN